MVANGGGPIARGRRHISSASTRRACFAWIGPAHRGPRLRRRRPAKGRPCGRRFSDRPRPDAKSHAASGDASANLQRSSVRNDSPSAEPSHRIGPLRVPQQIFDVAQAEGEPELEPNSLEYDLRRESIPAVADFLHSLGYWAAENTASPRRRDKAVRD